MSIQRGLGHWKIAPIDKKPAAGKLYTCLTVGRCIKLIPARSRIFCGILPTAVFSGWQADKQKTVTAKKINTSRAFDYWLDTKGWRVSGSDGERLFCIIQVITDSFGFSCGWIAGAVL